MGYLALDHLRCMIQLLLLFCEILSSIFYNILLASPNASSCFSDVDGKQSFAVHWEPPPESVYNWRHKRPKVPKSLRIYECHVGISGSESKITSFNEFTLKVIPINHGVKCIFWSQQDITLFIFIITKKCHVS